MRYALIESGVVVNVIEWDGDEQTWTPPERTQTIELADEPVSPGYSYDGKDFTPPAPKIVEPVKDWEAEITAAATLDELKAVLADRERASK